MVMSQNNDYVSGFVALVGRPNVGKSTLMNRIIGEKIAIVSDKPQTTRNQIKSIKTTDDYQMIFVDTPGIHKPKNKLGNFMVDAAMSTIHDVDVILVLFDVERGIGKGDQYIADLLKQSNIPVVVALNKIDRVSEEVILSSIKLVDEMGVASEIVPISAANGHNIEALETVLKGYLQEGPQYYPDEMITDQPERVIISEIVREKVLQTMNEEIPHGVSVDIEKIETDGDEKVIYITIYCEKKSHKGMLIGKNGSKLKEIKKRSRRDIQTFLDGKVNLQLWVKVKEDWRKSDRDIKLMGYDQLD